MSYTTTTRLGLQKAVVGSNQAFETAVFNANWDKVDAEAVAADGRLDSVEAINTTQNGRLDAAEGRLTSVEGVNTTQNGRLTTAEANIAALGAGTTVRVVSGTTDTVVVGDKNNVVVYNSATDVAVTVPNVLPVGARVDFVQNGSGQVVFTGSGVTLVGTGVKTAAQYAGATILAIGSGDYRLIGNIVA
jgi:hypothetical protein